jgi:hypothetical protein
MVILTGDVMLLQFNVALNFTPWKSAIPIRQRTMSKRQIFPHSQVIDGKFSFILIMYNFP